MKMLVVDDFRTTRTIIKKLLREKGHTDVYEAADGYGALSVLKAYDIDFVITDWNMPEMSGLALLQTIRASKKWAKIPVLMVTAESKREQLIEAAKAGVNGYVVKPFDSDTLSESIEKVLYRQQNTENIDNLKH